MSLLSENDARTLLAKVLALSVADQCNASLNGTSGGNVRYALNNVSTSGHVSDVELTIEVAFGQRSGIATTNQFDDASLLAVVRRAEELAKLAPENPEWMPALEKQVYPATATFAESTAGITPDLRAEVANACIAPCRKDKLVAAGFFGDAQRVSVLANKRGNFAYQQSTEVDFTCTVRTEDGRGSGWVSRNVTDVSTFDADTAVRVAIGKAQRSVGARALEPGKYTVILEPHACAQIMLYLTSGFDAREADEGRSFLSKKGGGNRVGERLFDERVTIYSDPADSVCAALPWDDAGLPRTRVPLVTRGTVEALQYSRYWAKQHDKPATAQIGNILMLGGGKSTAELIKGTRRGILVTRLYYVNIVDPQTLLLTGLTRDGTFYIENGEIKYPIKNFRFNESVVTLFNNIEAIGTPMRVTTLEGPPLLMRLPALKVREFTFTSLSDAV
ncbi:MAG: TldD/PmbA family protein [Tahibacter sp.]